jgi:hypothetical protein
MNTAESEYIEMVKCYYDPCDQEGRLQQQQTFLRLEAEADALAASIHRHDIPQLTAQVQPRVALLPGIDTL